MKRMGVTVLWRSVLLCVGLCLVGSLSADSRLAEQQSAELRLVKGQPNEPQSVEAKSAESQTDEPRSVEAQSPEPQSIKSQPVKSKSKGLQPLDAGYVVFYGVAKIADANISLSMKKRRTWRTRVQVMPVGVASWFVKETTVRSEFRVFNNQIYLSHTEYERGDEIYEGYWFDNEARALYKGRSYSLDAPRGVLDNLTMVLQAALSLDAMPAGRSHRQFVASRGEIREYEMLFEANERIKTDLGEFDTRVVSVRRHDKMRYRYWFSDAHDGIPVQVARLDGSNDGIVWKATLQRLQRR